MPHISIYGEAYRRATRETSERATITGARRARGSVIVGTEDLIPIPMRSCPLQAQPHPSTFMSQKGVGPAIRILLRHTHTAPATMDNPRLKSLRPHPLQLEERRLVAHALTSPFSLPKRVTSVGVPAATCTRPGGESPEASSHADSQLPPLGWARLSARESLLFWPGDGSRGCFCATGTEEVSVPDWLLGHKRDLRHMLSTPPPPILWVKGYGASRHHRKLGRRGHSSLLPNERKTREDPHPSLDDPRSCGNVLSASLAVSEQKIPRLLRLVVRRIVSSCLAHQGPWRPSGELDVRSTA